jgi:hypothetical protein
MIEQLLCYVYAILQMFIVGWKIKYDINTSLTRWQSGGVEEVRVKGLLNSELSSHTPLYPRCAPHQV